MSLIPALLSFINILSYGYQAKTCLAEPNETNYKHAGDDGYHDSAAKTINEETVSNVLSNGTEDPTGTWTVVDENNWNMVVTTTSVPTLSPVTSIAAAYSPTGKAITVNGAKFTPTAAGTYVFQYVKNVVVRNAKITTKDK